MGADLLSVFYWWVMIFGIGIVFLPLTVRLFDRFWDRGYALSKILGILLVSYVIWLLGSLKILPFYNETIWLVILGYGVVNYLLLIKFKNLNLKTIIKNNWRVFVFEEVLFSVCLAAWSIIRGYQPDIEGLEKFMDFGFINSILRSKFFPPLDMWLAGKTINYYYFGHLYSAVLTKLSGLDSAITYNLLMASMFALSFGAAFSFGGNILTLNYKFKILNPKQIINSKSKIIKKSLEFKKFENWNLFRISKLEIRIFFAGLLTAFLLTLGGNLHTGWWYLKHHDYKTYWYPDATRFIVEQSGAHDNTIHEFPIYSFVVADLHGHLLNLPLVLLFLCLVLDLVIRKKTTLLTCALAALLLGVFYMTNAWDFAIYHLIFGLTILWLSLERHKFKIETVLATAKVVFPVLIGSILFVLPFHLNFKSLVGGVALTDFHSPIWMLLVLWGFPLFITLSYLISLRVREFNSVKAFILILLGVSWFLIVFPEIFYLKDIYIHSYQRANTMFKLTYQSFVMFSLVTPAILLMIINSSKNKYFKFSFVILSFAFLFFIFRYPLFAIKSYYGLQNYRGLYGLNYLKTQHPDDYRAVIWLKENLVGQPVIAEAVGESYTQFARVSANTGLPTILGWRVHEWLWRGGFDEAGKRTGEVQEIYESTDLNKTKQLLNQYQVKYLFVGDMERQAYPNLNETKFTSLGQPVFTSGRTTIYRL